MSRKARTKPKDPQVAAAEARSKAFAVCGLQAGASTLKANADIDAKAKTRDHENQARRLDAFEALKDGMAPGAYDAARKFEQDIIIARGEHDRGRRPQRVDCETGKDRTDAMVDASFRVDLALGSIGQRDGWLLSELISPSVQTRLSCNSWRMIVAYITGEENPHAQAAVVRGACANLAAAYGKIRVAA